MTSSSVPRCAPRGFFAAAEAGGGGGGQRPASAGPVDRGLLDDLVAANRILRMEEAAASEVVALQLGVVPGARVFHSVIVHIDNGTPVQLEALDVRLGHGL